MIKIIQRLMFFILTGLLFQTSINARVITVPDQPDSTNIQPAILTALDSAINGDIISLPTGIFTLERNVLIRKFISFRGAGIGNTILFRSNSVPDDTLSKDTGQWHFMFKFLINKPYASDIVVSDITFKSKDDPLSLAKDMGIIMYNCVNFLITRCRFEYFGRSAVNIEHLDTLAKGLISNNEFYHNSKGDSGLGLGYGVEVYGANYQWIKRPNFGSDNFIFIENNRFELHRHSISAGGAGLYVARYNYFKDNLLGHCIDMHSSRKHLPGVILGKSNYYSTRAIEVYYNIIENTKFEDGSPIVPNFCVTDLTDKAISIRSEALVYENTISGYTYGLGIEVEPMPPNPQYAIPYAVGFLSGDSLGPLHTGTDSVYGNGDLFYWDNKFKDYGYSSCGDSSIELYNYNPQFFTSDRDYHTEAKPNYTSFTYPHPLNSLSPSFNTQPALIKLAVEGFYNAGSNQHNIADTIRIYLRRNSSPYNIIDSAKSVVDPVTMTGSFLFINAPTGTYYLQIKGRNCIETWSKTGGELYVYGNTFSYDLTTANAKAYGNNMRQVDASPVSFAIYSGDINQDGTIDAGDLSQAENDATNSLSGYVQSDVTGDDFVDAADLSIVENNAATGVSAILP